jgi:hypothetical protein
LKINIALGEDELFYYLCDYWKKGDFAPQKCGEVLNKIAKYKNKHPASEIKENLQEFRGLCRQYYTRDNAAFEAFREAMGGRANGKQNRNLLRNRLLTHPFRFLHLIPVLIRNRTPPRYRLLIHPFRFLHLILIQNPGRIRIPRFFPNLGRKRNLFHG